VILVECEQGSKQWHEARAGVGTASNCSRMRSRKGELTQQQQLYVNALLSGEAEVDARIAAGYRSKPSFSGLETALQGLPVGEPSDAAITEAWTVAIERIAGMPLRSDYESFAMKRGKYLEQLARAAYEERYGCLVMESGLMLTDDRRFGYSTDGAVMPFTGQPKGGIEVKCPTAPEKLGAAWTDPAGAEAEYIDQIEMGMWITGWHWVDLIIFCPWLESVGKHLFVKRIWRDDDRIEALERDLMGWLQMVDQFEAALRRETPTRFERLVEKFRAEAEADAARLRSPDGADALACAFSATPGPLVLPAAPVIAEPAF
jgi:hypothetical protein